MNNKSSANPIVQKVEKPWGYELIWAKTSRYVGKVLHITKGHRLSLQFHRLKEETFYLQTGLMTLLLENDQGVVEEHTLRPGDVRHVVPNRKHRMIAVENCDVFEVSTTELDDVVRLEDSYGRTEK